MQFKDQWEQDNEIDNSTECDSIAVEMTPQRKRPTELKQANTASPPRKMKPIKHDPKTGTSSFKPHDRPTYKEETPAPGQYTISHKQTEGTTKGKVKI